MRFSVIFQNREDAGKKLAARISSLLLENPIVLALPRGGLPVAYEIAQKIKAPLDIFLVRKIGAPNQPEFGIGAIAQGNVKILDKKAILQLRIPKAQVEKMIKEEGRELKRREALYRGSKPFPSLRDKTVILVDDGLATGLSAKAAILGVKRKKPKKIIFATPVCSYQSVKEIVKLCDDFICLKSSSDFTSVGNWYKDFDQLTDEAVLKLLGG